MSLSVQWGNAGNSGGSVDVTFPISFTKTVYQIQLTYNNSSYENPTYAIKDTKSFSYWCKYGGDKLWFAIGMQQWGKHARTTDYEQITFPISFTNVNYTCISTSYDLNSNADVTSAYSGTYNSGKYPEEQERTVSRFYVKTGSNAGGRDWIAIGVQQWGYSKSCTVKFHLPFPSQVFFCGIVLDTSYGYEFGPDQLAPKDLNPSGFTKYRDTFPNFWWFAIGKQQWGTNQPSPITFPLRFASKCLTVVPQLQASGDSGNMSKNRVCVSNLKTNGFAIEYPQSTYNYIAIGV